MAFKINVHFCLLYYIILYYTILYYIILYYIILYTFFPQAVESHSHKSIFTPLGVMKS